MADQNPPPPGSAAPKSPDFNPYEVGHDLEVTKAWVASRTVQGTFEQAHAAWSSATGASPEGSLDAAFGDLPDGWSYEVSPRSDNSSYSAVIFGPRFADGGSETAFMSRLAFATKAEGCAAALGCYEVLRHQPGYPDVDKMYEIRSSSRLASS